MWSCIQPGSLMSLNRARTIMFELYIEFILFHGLSSFACMLKLQLSIQIRNCLFGKTTTYKLYTRGCLLQNTEENVSRMISNQLFEGNLSSSVFRLWGMRFQEKSVGGSRWHWKEAPVHFSLFLSITPGVNYTIHI